jgi:hypothetical protein
MLIHRRGRPRLPAALGRGQALTIPDIPPHAAAAGSDPAAPVSPRGLTELQRTAGNRAVTRLVADHGAAAPRRPHVGQGSVQRAPTPRPAPPTTAGATGTNATPAATGTNATSTATGTTATPAGTAATPATTPPDADALPTEASLAKIETFDPLVRDHRLFKGRDRRIEFFLAERPFFGSDDRVIAHFAKIRKAAIPGARTLLHDDAATRLEAIAGELGTRMPRSGGVGWPRVTSFDRHHPQDISDPHTIGLAIDYNATEMPHMGIRDKRADPRTLDLILLVTGHQGWMELDRGSAKLFQEIDAATSKGEAERQKILARKDVADLQIKVMSESQILAAVSEQMRASLDAGALGRNRDRLIKLRTEMAAAKTHADQQRIMAELPVVLDAWIRVVEANRSKTELALRQLGFDPASMPAPAELRRQAAQVRRTIAQLNALKRPLALARRQLKGKRLSPRTAAAIHQRVTGLLGRARSLAAALPAPPGTGTAGTGTAGASTATAGGGTAAAGSTGSPAPAAGTGPAPAPDVTAPDDADVDAAEALVASALGTASLAQERLTKASGVKIWLDRLVNLATSLTSDPEFVLGRKNAKGAPVQEVSAPSLAQIADVGFYSTSDVSKQPGAFGEDFVLAAVQRGFTPGASWEQPDSMHFELRRPGGGT